MLRNFTLIIIFQGTHKLMEHEVKEEDHAEQCNEDYRWSILGGGQ